MFETIVKKVAKVHKLYQTEGAIKALQVIAKRLKVRVAGRLPVLIGYKVHYHGCEFDVSNAVISHTSIEDILLGLYEQQEVYAVNTYLNPLLPVIELGAGIGVISCITNKRLHNPSQHIVVEANPALLSSLQHNRELNDCKFQIVHAAINYGAAETTFYISNEFIGSSVKSVTSRPVSISTINLKTLLEDLSARPITLICDIEGVEISLIQHELSEIKAHVNTFIIEVHPPFCTDKEIENALSSIRDAGFEHVHNSAWVHIFCNRVDYSQHQTS